uniref:FBA_2 domain-containing protein n=1 Tax=Caenorhabditis tropicalis TaxID=1561998 RepID=A0A1I7UDG6_9PELO
MMLFGCLVFALLIPESFSKVFCDDVIGKYTAVAGNIVLTNLEFPIMSAVPAGSSASADLAVPKLMHPCYSLSVANNYKNQMSAVISLSLFLIEGNISSSLSRFI